MEILKSGKTSTEWITLGVVILLAAAKMFGIVPEDATAESVSAQATEAIPALINGVTKIAAENGSLLVMAGLAWAYMKRRSSLKAKALK